MSHRIWAEIWNAGETVMYGYVNLAGLTVERRLDGMGHLRLDMPVHDPSTQFAQIGRVARCYTTHPHGDKRFVATGLLQKSRLSVTSSGDTITWEARDRLEELRRRTTYMGRNYDGYSLSDATNDLMLLAPGWSLYLKDIEGDTSLRFDAVSLLVAMQTFAEVHGYHFRLGDIDHQLVFGTLGDDSGVRATNVRTGDHVIDGAGGIYLFDRLEELTDGDEIYNVVYPRMGNNEAFIDIGTWANEVGGIGGIVPGIIYTPQALYDAYNNPIYYLSDSASVAAYGERQKDLFAEKLFPAGATVDASAILFLFAQNWLLRHKDPQYSYRLSLNKWDNDLRLGDKLNVTYRGEVYQGGQKVRYADIDADLWVLKMTEQYSINGAKLDLEVSTVDLFPADPIDIITSAIESSKRRLAQPTLRLQKTTTSSSGTVNNSTPGTLTFTLSADALSIARANLTLTRANASTGPDTCDITINGTLVANGPYLNGANSGLSDTVNLRAYMTNSSITSYTISVSCLYGSGNLALSMELFEIIGSIS